MTVLVLGLGNPILTDDGVGVRVAEAVRRQLPADADVEIDEVSVGGLTLMERMVGYGRVVLVDAILTGDGPIGAVRRLTLDELDRMSPAQHTASPHDASLATAMALGRRMGMPLPDELVLVTVRVDNVLDFGEEPTPAVAAAIPEATSTVMGELRRWRAIADENGLIRGEGSAVSY